MTDTTTYAIDLDEEVLSHLANPEAVAFFRAERLDSTVIEDQAVRDIYRWQLDYTIQNGRPATPSVLAEEFDLEFQVPLTEPSYLIEKLRERFITNHAREYMEKVAGAYKENPAAVPATMVKVGRELGSIVNPVGESYGTGDVERVLHEYDQRVLRGPGASVGFKEIDDYTHGMRGVVMYIGSPKSHKSWMAGNALLQNILQGRKIWFGALELPAVEMNERVYAMACGIPPWKFLKGSLTMDERKLLKETAEVLDNSGLYRIEKPPPGSRSLPEMLERANAIEADVLIIDQLQYVETHKGIQLGSGDHKDYWNVLNEARDESDRVPIAFVHQFNRETKFMDEMPTMQYAKGAAACEEVATVIYGLWANKDMRASGIVHMGILASRHLLPQTWEIAVDLNRGCAFQCLGTASDD